MWTITYRIVRKGISQVWTASGSWSEALHIVHLDAAVEIISTERA